MKDAFKVKKGLNVQPTDPAEVVNPEAGDLIVDSTDDNRLKVYDPTSSEFAAVGTGGSSGNILSDIEKLTPTVSNVVAVTDTTTFLPIDDNNKSVKATFSGSDGTIRYEAPASADLDGVQGVVKVWIKTSLANLTLVATKDGVAQNNGLTVNSSNKWRQYEIPVVLGDADYGFEIKASGSVSGDVYIDEAVVTVEKVIQQLDTTITDWEPTTITFNMGSQTSTAYMRRVGDVLELRASVNFNGASSGNATFVLPNGLVMDDAKGISNGNYRGHYGNGTIFDGGSGKREVYVSNLVATPDTFQLVYENDTGSLVLVTNVAPFTIGIGDSIHFEASIPIQGWSSEKSTVVTQDIELLNGRFRINSTQTATQSGADIVFGVQSDYSGINNLGSAYNTSTGVFTVPKTGYYEFEAAVIIISASADVRPWLGISVNGTLLTYQSDSTGTQITNPLLNLSTGSLYLQKGDTVKIVASSGDVNSRSINASESNYFHIKESPVNKTIVGKFENINSTDLYQVEAAGNNGAAITSGNAVNFTEVKDLQNVWNGTNFTPQRDGSAIITGSIYTSAGSIDSQVRIFEVTDGYIKGCGYTNDAGKRVHPFSCEFDFQAGKSYYVGFNRSFTLSNLDTAHHIYIQELPDYQAIVKNLSDQKTKCQTKYLSAGVTADGNIAELSFSNLIVGKKYKVFIKNYVSGTVAGDIIVLRTVHNGSNNCYAVASVAFNGDSNVATDICLFNATVSTLDANALSISAGNLITGDGTDVRSKITLCELPDTYVETTEF